MALPDQNVVAENAVAKLQNAAMERFGALPQINPADPLGKRPNQYADYEKTLKDIHDKLEQRYEKPNWFDVAAGFAKPQLGGFIASLGSANEEMAKNIEQQRAQQMPLAALKVEMYKNQQLQNQAVDAKEIYDYEMEKFGYVREKAFGDITSLVSKDHPIAQGAEANREGRFKAKADIRADVGTQIEVGTASAQNPFLVVKTPLFNAGPQTEEEVQKLNGLLENARPPGFDKTAWASMGMQRKQDEVARYADAQMKQNMTEEAASLHDAKGAVDRLKSLLTVRELATDPDVAPVFSVLNNADAFSLFKKITDKAGGNLGAVMEGLKNAIRSQYTNENDPSGVKRQKADLLFKTIAQITVQQRNSALNPGEAYQELVGQATPGIDNSQKGFVSIVDQMGLREQQLIDEHILRVNSDIPAKQIFDPKNNPRLRDLREQYKKEAIELAKTDAFTRTPSWVDSVQVKIPPAPSSQGAPSNPESSRAAPSANPSANEPYSKKLERLERERLERERLQKEGR
jgi:hypothetical protein